MAKFISIRKMKRRYPDQDFRIIGEYFPKKPLEETEGFEVTTSDDLTIRVKNPGAYKRSRYRVAGYQHVKEDEYITVLRRNWIVPAVGLLLAAALIIGGYLLWKMGRGPDIDPSVKDYVSELKRPDNLDETKILVPGYTSLVMDADTDILLDSTLFNPQGNPCYFRFTIVDDKGEELYKSKLVPPGKGVSEVKLNRKISEGIYNIKIKINSYDLNDYEAELNGAEIDSELRALR